MSSCLISFTLSVPQYRLFLRETIMSVISHILLVTLFCLNVNTNIFNVSFIQNSTFQKFILSLSEILKNFFRFTCKMKDFCNNFYGPIPLFKIMKRIIMLLEYLGCKSVTFSIFTLILKPSLFIMSIEILQ